MQYAPGTYNMQHAATFNGMHNMIWNEWKPMKMHVTFPCSVFSVWFIVSIILKEIKSQKTRFSRSFNYFMKLCVWIEITCCHACQIPFNMSYLFCYESWISRVQLNTGGIHFETRVTKQQNINAWQFISILFLFSIASILLLFNYIFQVNRKVNFKLNSFNILLWHAHSSSFLITVAIIFYFIVYCILSNEVPVYVFLLGKVLKGI